MTKLQALNIEANTAKAELDAIRNAEGKMNPFTHARLVAFAEARYDELTAKLIAVYCG